jgi:hypothetical protein
VAGTGLPCSRNKEAGVCFSGQQQGCSSGEDLAAGDIWTNSTLAVYNWLHDSWAYRSSIRVRIRTSFFYFHLDHSLVGWCTVCLYREPHVIFTRKLVMDSYKEKLVCRIVIYFSLLS